MVIDVPRKVSRPKVASIYQPPLFSNDVDEGIFLFKELGRAVFQPTPWKPGYRNDIIVFDKKNHNDEFFKFKINNASVGAVLPILKNTLKTFWDCFVTESIKRVILGYEFGIDTGNATPVCYRKPHYGPHESTVILKHIKVLLGNDWVEQCQGGWGSPIVLAPKPHQEGVVDIEDFVWRMCVSYRGLNKVTNPFEYPIGRCDNAIEDLGDASGTLYCICLDKAQGCHQIGVKKSDKEKLAFFGPDGKSIRSKSCLLDQ